MNCGWCNGSAWFSVAPSWVFDGHCMLPFPTSSEQTSTQHQQHRLLCPTSSSKWAAVQGGGEGKCAAAAAEWVITWGRREESTFLPLSGWSPRGGGWGKHTLPMEDLCGLQAKLGQTVEPWSVTTSICNAYNLHDYSCSKKYLRLHMTKI